MQTKNEYDFTGKAIKCDTFVEMQYLSDIAREQGLKDIGLISKNDFDEGNKYFVLAANTRCYLSVSKESGNELVVAYRDFINSPIQQPESEQEIIEVTCCAGCPFANGETCFFQSKFNMEANFSTCPLKEKETVVRIKKQ